MRLCLYSQNKQVRGVMITNQEQIASNRLPAIVSYSRIRQKLLNYQELVEISYLLSLIAIGYGGLYLVYHLLG